MALRSCLHVTSARPWPTAWTGGENQKGVVDGSQSLCESEMFTRNGRQTIERKMRELLYGRIISLLIVATIYMEEEDHQVDPTVMNLTM